MTQASANKLLAKWRKFLCLEEWEMTIVLQPKVGDNNWGQVYCYPCKQRARIELQSGRPDADIEATLVHEMVHVVLSAMAYQINPKMGCNVVEEQAVNKLAACLLLMYCNMKPAKKRR